jgi:hypothetical protein
MQIEGMIFHFQRMQTKTICIISFCLFPTYFGQNPRSTETWNNTTVRAGVALKFGQGKTFKKLLNADSFVFCRFSSNVPGDLNLLNISLRNYIILTMDQVKYLIVMFY